MFGARAQNRDAGVNHRMPMMKTWRRPRRSAHDPALRTTVANASVYASITHCRALTPVSRSDAIDGRAVLTTAMSSMSIAVLTHTASRVARRTAVFFGVIGAVMARPDGRRGVYSEHPALRRLGHIGRNAWNPHG